MSDIVYCSIIDICDQFSTGVADIRWAIKKSAIYSSDKKFEIEEVDT
jgi:hypothetical protein